MNTTILSSFDKYTTFSFGGKTLTFRTCNGLKYTENINFLKVENIEKLRSVPVFLYNKTKKSYDVYSNLSVNGAL